MDVSKFNVGDVIAKRGSSDLLYAGIREEDGMPMGIVSDAYGTRSKPEPVQSILARGYWEPSK
jgi:hypothetical protein